MSPSDTIRIGHPKTEWLKINRILSCESYSDVTNRDFRKLNNKLLVSIIWLSGNAISEFGCRENRLLIGTNCISHFERPKLNLVAYNAEID